MGVSIAKLNALKKKGGHGIRRNAAGLETVAQAGLELFCAGLPAAHRHHAAARGLTTIIWAVKEKPFYKV